MQILGIYVPPLVLRRCRDALFQDSRLPVVFIGPYEHHSNVVPWREGLCDLVEIEPAPDGGIDPAALEAALSDPRWRSRPKIGCFSAASNVTGMRTDVYEIAARLHRHDALACFDWAAAAPYEDLDVRGRDGAFLDAVSFSPHKFAGGPGSSGVLIFHQRLYRRDLPPSFGGGGTVAYVGPRDHDFLPGIEEREKPGTPGILQVLRAALAVQVRDRIGVDRIREIEDRYLRVSMERLGRNPRIEILGNTDPAKRIGIVAFNLRHGERYLHPRYVTRLLSDLFGIQTRAGCSCAGPYGHRLLQINEPTSERYRSAIGDGCQLIKPGWVRFNVHFTHTPEELDYLLECIEFVAEHGPRFLALYDCELASGTWTPRGWIDSPAEFGLDHALSLRDAPPARAGSASQGDPEAGLRRARSTALREARERAAGLPPDAAWIHLPGSLEALSFFHMLHLREAESDQRDTMV
jgi:selenocysteine lyase/cysteine desulfurase